AAVATVTEDAPVTAPAGSTRTVYVPATGSVWTSMNAPLDVIVALACVEPSGRTSAIEPALTGVEVNLTVTFWFRVPANVTFAFWPGIVVVTVAADPPTVVDA